MTNYNNDGRFTGKMRTGAEFLEGLKNDWPVCLAWAGELIWTIKPHPAFSLN